MKSLVMALALTVGSSAFAGKRIVCNDMNGGPDHGYIVSLDAKMKKAIVSRQTIAGPRRLATLTCFPVQSDSNRRGADMIYPVATCYIPELADAGYIAQVSAGGFAGWTQVELLSTSLMGAEKLANLICRF